MQNHIHSVNGLFGYVRVSDIPFDKVNLVEDVGQVALLAGKKVVHNPNGEALPDKRSADI